MRGTPWKYFWIEVFLGLGGEATATPLRPSNMIHSENGRTRCCFSWKIIWRTQMAIDGFSGGRPKTDASSSAPESATAASFSEESRDVHERHLATDHLLTDLKSRTITSRFITAGAQCAKFIVNVMSTVVLARLLSPHEFGLVVMVTAITSLFRVFRGAGRSGPVSAIDLLAGFLRHLPSWAIVFAGTWLTRAAVTDLSPVMQLFICVPVGLLAAGCSVCGFPNQRRTALLCLKTVRSLRKA